MKKNKTVVLCLLIFAVVIVFTLLAVTITNSEMSSVQHESSVRTEEASGKEDPAGDTKEGESDGSGKADKAAAEELVGMELTRDEVEEALGKWNDFNMDGNGCERGVYAGRFYYDDFILYSRTYNQGKTFRIMSVNEQ